MVVGIGAIGMITGSIATYFIEGRSSADLPPSIEFAREELERWHDLTSEERQALVALLDAMASDGGVERRRV